MPFHPDESTADEFNFYNNFAKTSVLRLIDTKECAMGAQWIKFLNANRASPGAVVALKLMIMCLNRGRLSFPFDEPPPEDLSMFESDLQERDLAHMILSETKRSMMKSSRANPQVTTSLSADSCQLVAVQEIPKFGIHCYFATSDEPVSSWQGGSGTAMPTDGNPLAWEKCMANMSSSL